MKKIKVAFVGAGYMASEHLKAFEATGSAEVVGITSRTRERAEKLVEGYPSVRVFDSIEALYQGTDADIVVVSVTELSMASIAQECFSYPWVVLLEKPAGYDLNDARTIRDAASEKGARAYVALNRRSYSSTRQAVQRLSVNEGPRFIKVVDQQDQHAALTIHNNPPLMVENYMYANSIHLIDYFRVLGRGDIVDVENISAWDPANPGVVLASVKFSSGDIGLYEGIWNGPGPWTVTVSTPAERLEMRPLEQLSVQLCGERQNNPQPIETIDSEFKPGIFYQAQEAIKVAQGQPSSLPSLDDSYASMELVSRIFGLSR